MKHIALHILQPFPPSCLNRDDVGAPKNAIFGGVTRARISSQCLKRAIRMHAKELQPKLYAGIRSCLFISEIAKLLAPRLPDQANALAKCAAHYLAKLDPKDNNKVKTLMFLSPDEYKRLADVLVGLPNAERQELCDALARTSPEELEKAEAEGEEGSKATKEKPAASKSKGKDKPLTAKQFNNKLSGVLKSPIRKEFKQSFVKDAADIAIFGRMVANDATLNIEAAGLFSHAISTHACDNDLDFWTAVDDAKGLEEEPGAANMGHAEFNAACYYRYAALNLDLLFYQKTTNGRPSATLSCFASEEYKATRHAIVEAFLRAVILAVPPAKHTGMNANLPPEYVFGTVATGQPMQLVNAFESPVRANGQGWLKPSVDALKKQYDRLKKVFGLEPLITEEVELSEQMPLARFIEKLVAHVQ